MIKTLKRMLAAVYSVPYLGYAARLVVAFAKLPRINIHLRRIEEANKTTASRLGELDARRAELATRCEGLALSLNTLEASWHQHVPALLNAASSIGAFGHELARQTESAIKHQTFYEERMNHVLDGLAELRADNERHWSVTANTESRLEACNVPALQATVERHWRKIGEMEERLEFVRREILFEMRYGRYLQPTPARVEPRIVNLAALETEDLRLNLGCGHVPLTGYVNVDARELPGVDLVASLDNLPFSPHTASEILLAHVIEHFPLEELRISLLPHWVRLLKNNGIIRIIVPDADAMIKACATGHYSFDDFREVFFGAQEYAGDFHFNMYTPDSLTRILKAAGAKNVNVVAAARRNGRCFEFEVEANFVISAEVRP